MIQPVEYCEKCGKYMTYIQVFMRGADDSTIVETVPICRKCLLPIDIDLRKWADCGMLGVTKQA